MMPRSAAQRSGRTRSSLFDGALAIKAHAASSSPRRRRARASSNINSGSLRADSGKRCDQRFHARAGAAGFDLEPHIRDTLRGGIDAPQLAICAGGILARQQAVEPRLLVRRTDQVAMRRDNLVLVEGREIVVDPPFADQAAPSSRLPVAIKASPSRIIPVPECGERFPYQETTSLGSRSAGMAFSARIVSASRRGQPDARSETH